MTTVMNVAGPAPPSHGVSAIPRSPNLAAEQLTARTYLSHSQISLMRSCPRKFAYIYIEKAPPDFIPSSLIFGGSIHASLETYFRAKLEGIAITASDLLSTYHDAWTEQLARAREQAGGTEVPVRFNKTDTPASVHATAERMLAAFLNSTLAEPKGTILGVEEQLRVMLSPDLPDVLAKVDLVTHTEGWLHVVDFKTSRSRWTAQKAEESADQLLLYAVTLAELSRSLGLPARLHFAVITKAKTPVVQLLPVQVDPGRVEVLTQTIAQVWEAIRAGNFYPSPSPMNCTTCPFRSRCPAMSRK